MTEYPVVGGREPCPCGSGRRYKACHGRGASRAALTFVARPFEGLPGECDWVAMREIVPCALAEVTLADGGRKVLVATALPNAIAALHRKDGVILVGLQTPTGSGDASRDVAGAILAALDSEPGDAIGAADPQNTVRLQEILDLTSPFEVEVADGFNFWFSSDEELSEEAEESLKELAEGMVETVRFKSPIGAAYWCDFPDRSVVRWVLDTDEERALDGIARLSVAGSLTIGDGSRYLGAFRADGLLVPVWEVERGKSARTFEIPLTVLHRDFEAAVTSSRALSSDERRARAGIVGRQLTLR
ncbi:MAG TPA: DUF5926 family protein [Candidatus Nanopelagicaceae bacterium]|nr:DUF5926 family protein [Candidatus Nanopelagicaceae bacterium]